MLFRQDVLRRIAEGDVTLAFRRWRRPTAKAGGTLRTRVGVLAIDSVEPVDEAQVTDADARRAGAADRETLLAGLDAGKHALAVEIATLPEEMRGFGHIKARNVAATRKKGEALLAQYRAAPSAQRAAA